MFFCYFHNLLKVFTFLYFIVRYFCLYVKTSKQASLFLLFLYQKRRTAFYLKGIGRGLTPKANLLLRLLYQKRSTAFCLKAGLFLRFRRWYHRRSTTLRLQESRLRSVLSVERIASGLFLLPKAHIPYHLVYKSYISAYKP
jgi:hypothetical protein